MEIMKRVVDVKYLIRCRSVCKQWKSFIDSSEFITHHHNTQPHHRMLIRYKVASSEIKYVSIIDDDDSFPEHNPIIPPSLVSGLLLVGCSHGLVCLFGLRQHLIVLWNPSIRKSVGIVLPDLGHVVGFGVCPKTNELKIVEIPSDRQARVFTLSSRAWRCVPSPGFMDISSDHVVIDGVIYWPALTHECQ
ncbi:F-box protein At5g18160-like [Bidens hawaiensis]|uniref:F-box protein At5g18160-like n=1 Tax=Bidens hawaiensis TaxID=980011 RepID=UPI00404B885A